VDKRRKIDKVLVRVVEQRDALLEFRNTTGYKLPLYKQQIFYPCFGSTFYMLYGKTPAEFNGAISKISYKHHSFDRYVPYCLRV